MKPEHCAPHIRKTNPPQVVNATPGQRARLTRLLIQRGFGQYIIDERYIDQLHVGGVWHGRSVASWIAQISGTRAAELCDRLEAMK